MIPPQAALSVIMMFILIVIIFSGMVLMVFTPFVPIYFKLLIPVWWGLGYWAAITLFSWQFDDLYKTDKIFCCIVGILGPILWLVIGVGSLYDWISNIIFYS